MKPIKKKIALIWTIVISVVIALGLVFTFIPMQFGKTKFLSFAGNVKIASDLKPGMYGEYTFSGSPSSSDVLDSVSKIKSVLSEYGYPSANVYGISGNKLRVEIANTTNGDFSKTESFLNCIDVGKFELRTGTGEDTMFISGPSHITGVKIGNSGGKTYVMLSFNSEGLAAYKANMKSSNTIYVYMGGQLQTSFAGSSTTYDDLYLTFDEYDSAYNFKLNVLLGCLNVEFNPDLTEINTLSATLSNAGLTADINSANYAKSDVLVLLSLALTLCVLAVIAFLAIKFRAFGITTFIVVIIESIILLFFMQALTRIEVSAPVFAVMALGYALSLFGSIVYIFKVKAEFEAGKTIQASLESGFKKSLPISVCLAIMLMVTGSILAIFTSGAMWVCGIMCVLFSLISLLANALLLPLFMKFVYAFFGNKLGAYGMKREGE